MSSIKRKIIQAGNKPGAVIQITEEEAEALKKEMKERGCFGYEIKIDLRKCCETCKHCEIKPAGEARCLKEYWNRRKYSSAKCHCFINESVMKCDKWEAK